jgi:hypothetical protein
MSLLKVKLITAEPVLFGQDNKFMTLGKLETRGDKFIVFMDLTTGKTYIEEAFASWVGGERITGLEQVEDDHLWGLLTEAAQKYGLCMVRHMADNMKKVNVKVKLNLAKLLCMVPDDMKYFQKQDVIKE